MILFGLVMTFAANAIEVESVKVSDVNDFMGVPVLRLGSPDVISVNFDIIGEKHDYLRYRFRHLNADDRPSSLMESEFLEGFNEWEVEDYAYSDNTYVHYVNYNIDISPTTHTFTYSGNYQLEIYTENDPDNVILKVPFYVSEDSVNIIGEVDSRTDKGFNTEFQQLELSVDSPNLQGVNPYQEIKVVVTQNNTPETERFVSTPMRIDRDRIIYSHIPELIFDAGNEYRRFETVRTDYAGLRVDSVRFINGMWHAWVREDMPRVENPYEFDSTQHGRFKIDEYNSTDPNLGSDYVMVHFILDLPEQRYSEVYIDGEFTNYLPEDKKEMKYDKTTDKYEVTIPLKQGSYNYRYLMKDKNSGRKTPSPIEGNKYETRNEYFVRVYLMTPGSRGDRLIGHKIINVN